MALPFHLSSNTVSNEKVCLVHFVEFKLLRSTSRTRVILTCYCHSAGKAKHQLRSSARYGPRKNCHGNLEVCVRFQVCAFTAKALRPYFLNPPPKLRKTQPQPCPLNYPIYLEPKSCCRSLNNFLFYLENQRLPGFHVALHSSIGDAVAVNPKPSSPQP